MTQPTDTDPIFELLRLVDVLSQEHTVIVDDKKGRFLGSRQEKPLLLKLRNAVASNTGKGGGDGKPGRERTPMNVGAADLQQRIVGEIREWYGRETDYAETGKPSPESTLRQWYLRFVGRYRLKQISDDSMWARISTVTSWVQQIRDMIDPPFRFPLTSPCPSCGQEWVEAYSDDDAEIERVRALNAVEREKIEESYVVCKGCDKVWRGVFEARQLRIAIDDADAARIA